jgi:hypothetical protein
MKLGRRITSMGEEIDSFVGCSSSSAKLRNASNSIAVWVLERLTPALTSALTKSLSLSFAGNFRDISETVGTQALALQDVSTRLSGLIERISCATPVFLLSYTLSIVESYSSRHFELQRFQHELFELIINHASMCFAANRDSYARCNSSDISCTTPPNMYRHSISFRSHLDLLPFLG